MSHSSMTTKGREALAKNLKIRAVTGKGLDREQRQELRRRASNLEAVNRMKSAKSQ